MCFLFHQWEKWETYEYEAQAINIDDGGQRISQYFLITNQSRICKKCNKREDKRVYRRVVREEYAPKNTWTVKEPE